MNETTRVCKDCQIEKPLDQFPLTYGTHGARRQQCRSCRSAYMKAYSAAHRKKVRVDPPPGYRRCTLCEEVLPCEEFFTNGVSYGKQRLRSSCRTCETQRVMRYNREHAEAMRGSNYGRRLKRYGITHEEYARLLALQHGPSAICNHPPRGSRRLGVDHHHETGQVRGLLCHRCNLAIAVFDDSPGALARATEYLADH